MRSKAGAVLVGINTVLKDNPYLTARNKNGVLFKTQPARIILDAALKIPLTANVIKKNGGKVFIAADKKLIRDKKKKSLEEKGVKILSLNSYDGKINLKELLRKLYQEGIYHVLVEGGAKVISSFIDSKLTDELYIFINSTILGGGYPVYNGVGFKISNAPRLKNIKYEKFKDTFLIKGELYYV